jgi:mRNA interferase MazF
MAGSPPKRFHRRGEIYTVDFNPARGSEQAGKRPALVVSNDTANQYSPNVTVVAVTSTVPSKEYPVNVHLPAGVLPLEGTILAAQIMTISKERLLNYRGTLDAAQMRAVEDALRVALGLPRLAD